MNTIPLMRPLGNLSAGKGYRLGGLLVIALTYSQEVYVFATLNVKITKRRTFEGVCGSHPIKCLNPQTLGVR